MCSHFGGRHLYFGRKEFVEVVLDLFDSHIRHISRDALNFHRVHRTVYKFTTKPNTGSSHLSEMPIMNEGRSSLGCSVIHTKESKMLVAGGGYALSLLSKNGLKSIEVLNLSESSSSWVTVGQMRESRFGFIMGSLLNSNTMIVVGGVSSNGLTNQMEKFEINGWKSNPVCNCPL